MITQRFVFSFFQLNMIMSTWRFVKTKSNHFEIVTKYKQISSELQSNWRAWWNNVLLLFVIQICMSQHSCPSSTWKYRFLVLSLNTSLSCLVLCHVATCASHSLFMELRRFDNDARRRCLVNPHIKHIHDLRRTSSSVIPCYSFTMPSSLWTSLLLTKCEHCLLNFHIYGAQRM